MPLHDLTVNSCKKGLATFAGAALLFLFVTSVCFLCSFHIFVWFILQLNFQFLFCTTLESIRFKIQEYISGSDYINGVSCVLPSS